VVSRLNLGAGSTRLALDLGFRNLYTVVSFRRKDSSSDKVSSLCAVATGVGKSNGDEALNDDDGEYEDKEEDNNDDDGDYKEEEESISNETDDISGGAGALLHDRHHVIKHLHHQNYHFYSTKQMRQVGISTQDQYFA